MRSLAVAALAVLLISLSGAKDAYVQAPTRSGDWLITAATMNEGNLLPYQEATESFLHEDLGDGTPERLTYGGYALYTSPIRKAEFPFNAVGARWSAFIPEESYIFMELRVSDDGAAWSEWLPMPEVDQFRGEGMSSTDLMLTSGSYLQFRMKLLADSPEQLPTLREVQVTYIDSSAGPSVGSAESGKYRVQATDLPPVISRAAWGANEAYRFRNGREAWRPQYVAPKKLIIHHTGMDTKPDPAATVRALYYYQAVTLGWGDIGYNYVVDHEGRVYEGRHGGGTETQHVIGGHARQFNTGSIGIVVLGNFMNLKPTPAMQDGLSRLVAQLAERYNINVMGSGFFINKVMPNVAGHRDCYATACPGDLEYALLPAVRQQAAQLIGNTAPETPTYTVTASPTETATPSPTASPTQTPTTTPSATPCAGQAPVTGAPRPVGPSNCSDVAEFGTTLQWVNPFGAAQYEIRILPFGFDGPALDMIRNTDGIGGGFDILPAPDWYFLLPDMSYTWMVRTATTATVLRPDDPHWGPWSPAWVFRTPKANSFLTPVLPTEGTMVKELTPTLQWHDTDPSIWYYEVQLSADPAFATDAEHAKAPVYWNLAHGGVSTPRLSWTVPADAALKPDTTYYWRVRPRVQGDGTPMAWSEAWTFTTP